MGRGAELDTGQLSLFSPMRVELEAPRPPPLESENPRATSGENRPQACTRGRKSQCAFPKAPCELGWPWDSC